jgi:hypothetical protein
MRITIWAIVAIIMDRVIANIIITMFRKTLVMKWTIKCLNLEKNTKDWGTAKLHNCIFLHTERTNFLIINYPKIKINKKNNPKTKRNKNNNNPAPSATSRLKTLKLSSSYPVCTPTIPSVSESGSKPMTDVPCANWKSSDFVLLYSL